MLSRRWRGTQSPEVYNNIWGAQQRLRRGSDTERCQANIRAVPDLHSTRLACNVEAEGQAVNSFRSVTIQTIKVCWFLGWLLCTFSSVTIQTIKVCWFLGWLFNSFTSVTIQTIKVCWFLGWLFNSFTSVTIQTIKVCWFLGWLFNTFLGK